MVDLLPKEALGNIFTKALFVLIIINWRNALCANK